MNDYVTLPLRLPAEVHDRLTALAELEFRTPKAQAAWLVQMGLDRAMRPTPLRRDGTERALAMADLLTRLRELHLQAGNPSSRAIGEGTGFSHTTVAAVLNGSASPSWKALSKIVMFLGGDPEGWRAAWAATR